MGENRKSLSTCGCLVLLGLAVIIGSVMFLPTGSDHKPSTPPPAAKARPPAKAPTREQNRVEEPLLREGVNYAEACQILGSPGTKTATMAAPRGEIMCYEWVVNERVLVKARFLDDALTEWEKRDIPPPPVVQEPEASDTDDITLNAVVTFSGTEFIITNSDGFDWVNPVFEVNGGFFKGGYTYKMPGRSIPPGTYTVGAMQFAKKDGTRLNPFQVKPLDMSIRCDAGSHSRGFAYFKWN